MTRLASATLNCKMKSLINHGLREAQKLGTVHERPGWIAPVLGRMRGHFWAAFCKIGPCQLGITTYTPAPTLRIDVCNATDSRYGYHNS